MKKHLRIYICILTIFSFMYLGCEEKVEILKFSSTESGKITTRGITECSECPNLDDCCCNIIYTGSIEVLLKICGTTDGDAVACQADIEGCETIDGLSHSQFSLSSGDRIELFCMSMVRGFYIENLTGSTVNLTLTCQAESLGPQTLIVSIPAYSRKYFQTDGECIVEECGH